MLAQLTSVLVNISRVWAAGGKQVREFTSPIDFIPEWGVKEEKKKVEESPELSLSQWKETLKSLAKQFKFKMKDNKRGYYHES